MAGTGAIAKADTSDAATVPDGRIAGDQASSTRDLSAAPAGAFVVQSQPDGTPPAMAITASAPLPFATFAAAAITSAPEPAGGAKRVVVDGVTPSAVPIEIGLKSLAGINRFDIRLSPDDLGQVDVRLDIDEHGRVSTHLTVERPEALLALHRESGHLSRALEQAGLKPAEDGVSLSLRQQGAGDGGRSDRDGGNRPSPTAPSPIREADEGYATPVADAVRRYGWARPSGVDRRI